MRLKLTLTRNGAHHRGTSRGRTTEESAARLLATSYIQYWHVQCTTPRGNESYSFSDSDSYPSPIFSSPVKIHGSHSSRDEQVHTDTHILRRQATRSEIMRYGRF